MTFDAWIAKMLDALKDESGGKPAAKQKAKKSRPNTNPVMIREVSADGKPQRPPPVFVAPPRLAPAPQIPAPATPQRIRLSTIGVNSPIASHAAQRRC